MKNIAQFFWDLAGVAGRKATPLPPTTPAKSQKNWAVFFLVGGGWKCWCVPRISHGRSTSKGVGVPHVLALEGQPRKANPQEGTEQGFLDISRPNFTKHSSRQGIMFVNEQQLPVYNSSPCCEFTGDNTALVCHPRCALCRDTFSDSHTFMNTYILEPILSYPVISYTLS
jgi:hypothetical protein